jgi:methyltransferase (TIGR00027 family)
VEAGNHGGEPAAGPPVSRTARYVALFRAIESARPVRSRLFEDPLARGFLDCRLRLVASAAGLPLLRSFLPWYIDRRWRGALSSLVIRTRLIDDALAEALAAGVAQVVILGAGFDSRAYRTAGLGQGRVFELDRREVLDAKRGAIERMLGTPPAHVVYVPVDFERDDLAEKLSESGYRTEPSFFIWEGVTSYLTAAGVDDTLRRVRGVSPPGSGIVFTYLDRRALDGSRAGLEPWAASADRAGERFTFGFDPAELSGYLAERGFELIEDVSTAQAAPRYLRALGRGGEASSLAHVARASSAVPSARGRALTGR